MELEIALGSAVIAAIISGFVSYIISRRQDNLQYITGERAEWREKMREIASKLEGASYDETLKVLTELKVRINAFGSNKVSVDYLKDAHIWELIDELEVEMPTEKILKLKQQQLIEYISLLLKYDWEKSKNEVKGNVYDVASAMLFLGAGAIFAISIFISNVNKDITRFDLAIMIGIYILSIVFLNVLFIFEVRSTCATILRGVITTEAKNHSSLRLAICYLLWGATVVALVVIYAIVVKGVFTLIGDGQANGLLIALLILIYMFGLGLQFVSQTLNVDKEYYYVVAIDKIWEKSKQRGGENTVEKI